MPHSNASPAAGPLDVASSEEKCIVVFEGGGARGLAHVGAYRALLAAGYRPIAVGGTSAGSIIAALVAAGFSPDELLDPLRERSVLDLINTERKPLTPVDLFGRQRWNVFTYARGVLQRFLKLWKDSSEPIPSRISESISPILKFIITAISISLNLIPLAISFIISIIIITPLFVYFFLFRRGVFDTIHLEQYLEKALRLKCPLDKNRGDNGNSLIRFTEIPTQLCVVATNIDSKIGCVFSREKDGFAYPCITEASVPHAVAASVSIPVIFQPKIIGDTQYYDGGIVSNLPIWAFDDLRRQHPNIKTIAFRIFVEPPIIPRNIIHLIQAVAGAAVLGQQGPGRRAIDNLLVVDVPSKIGLLGFDLKWRDAKRLHDEAFEKAAEQIRFHLGDVPRAVAELMQTVIDYIEDLEPTKDPTRRTRAAIFVPVSKTYLKIKYRVNMDSDPDDHAILPRKNSIAGNAISENFIAGNTNSEKFIFYGEGDELRACWGHSLDEKYRRALCWGELNAVLALPLINQNTGSPIAVLSIDSNRSFSYVAQFVEELSTLAQDMTDALLDKRIPLDGDDV